MANEIRRWYDWVGGLVEDNPLASSATTLTSAGLAALPAVGSTEHVIIVFDPDGLTGAPFAKRVTAHTAAATTATIEAAAVIGTARQIDRDIPWVHSVVSADVNPTGLIALTSYNPGSLTTQTAGSSDADVDATNLKVDFTVPPSGKVRVVLEAFGVIETSLNFMKWTLRESTTTIATAAIGYQFTDIARKTAIFYVSGLTPGTAKTYKWGHQSAGTGRTRYGGSDIGPAIMEVWAVNV